MSKLSEVDFPMRMAAGKDSVYSSVNKFGRGAAIGAAIEDVWDPGGTWVEPPVAQLHTLVSTAAGDTQAVQIEGVDTNWDLQSEAVTLTGTTPVNTANSYLRVFRVYNNDTTTFAGTITIAALIAGTTQAQILVPNNQTLMAIYAVPNAFEASVTQLWAAIGGASAAGVKVDISLWTRKVNKVWRIQHFTGIIDDGTSHFTHKFDPPLYAPQKTDIKVTATPDKAATDISAGFDLILGPQ